MALENFRERLREIAEKARERGLEKKRVEDAWGNLREKWESRKEEKEEQEGGKKEAGKKPKEEKPAEKTEKEGEEKKSSGKNAITTLVIITALYVFMLGPSIPEAFGLQGNLPGSVDTPFSNYLGRQAEQYVAPSLQNFVNTPVSGVPLKFLGEQVGCWFGSSFVPSEVIKMQTYSTTKAWDECKKNLVKDKAEEIGCTNCYGISSFGLETIGVQQAVMSLTLDTPEGKEYCRSVGGSRKCEDISPAKNPKLSVLYDSSKVTDLRGVQLGTDKESIVVGGKNEISPLIFPLDIRAFIPLSCATKGFTPKAIFSYDYQAFGSASISLRQESVTKAPTFQNPVTFPGPMKLDLIPRPKDFAFDRDAEISVTIILRNAGAGDAKINNVFLKQNPPLQLGENRLIFRGCAGPYSGDVTTPDGTKLDPTGNMKPETTKIPSFVSVLGKKQESSSIICSFVPDNNVKGKITDISTFSFEATADYTYQITQKGEAVSVEEVLTCDIPTTGWKSLEVAKDSDIPANWNSLTFTDTGWNLVNLPDTGKCTTGCSRLYRKMIIPLTGQNMFLNVASDDGAVCYLINKDSIKNLWSENAINDEHLLGKSIGTDKIKYGCDSQSSFDYCAKLNNFNLKSGEANIIACKVNNKAGEEIGFAVSTNPKIYSGT